MWSHERGSLEDLCREFGTLGVKVRSVPKHGDVSPAADRPEEIR